MAALGTRTALVTGASRGIGRAVARRLARDGVLVAVHYGHNEAAAAGTVATIEQAGGKAFPVRAELGVAGDVDTLIVGVREGLSTRTGSERLDILVNNAGFSTTFFEATTQDIFDHLFAVNTRAPFFLIQRALPLMGEGGRIVSISSAATRIAVSDVAYAMAKATVNAMGQTLAHLLGERGITVNTVAPGAVDTDLTAGERHDQPEMRQVMIDMTALAGSAPRPTSPTWWPSSPPMMPAGSPVNCWRSVAACSWGYHPA
jgi:3-oxoacyl-[acyl-carrier protein] reductase